MALGTQGAEELKVLEHDATEATVCGLLTGVFGGEARSYTASSSSELSAASKVGLWPAERALAFALAKQRAAAELVDGSLEPSMRPCRRRGFTPKPPMGHGPVMLTRMNDPVQASLHRLQVEDRDYKWKTEAQSYMLCTSH
ncbi:unnamed protein product [Miscanthus lutarioriparius]|uniref:Uncharacterized protein n=1 Tax=Miscanthus lutarioriparius TaxID=422564 RepID=A0A811QBI9_9POAL|nr:unnamed protein product [Miscanthus lutarioriparius]